MGHSNTENEFPIFRFNVRLHFWLLSSALSPVYFFNASHMLATESCLLTSLEETVWFAKAACYVTGTMLKYSRFVTQFCIYAVGWSIFWGTGQVTHY